MLSIRFKSVKVGIKNVPVIKDFHIGERMILTYAEIDNILDIQLDSDELSRIINTWTNLPMNKNGYVMIYYGDLAKTVILNWKELQISDAD